MGDYRHPKTCNISGHAHELTFSCFGGYPFLNCDRTRQWIAEALDVAREKLNFSLWAYVLMPEHVHLIVCPDQPIYSMEAIRQAIKEPVARKAIAYLREQSAEQWLERIRVDKGKRTRYRFWQQGKGYDRNIEKAETLLKMIDYIHMNPVRRGLVERAEDWAWSSAGHFVNGLKGPIAVDAIPPAWLEMD